MQTTENIIALHPITYVILTKLHWAGQWYSRFPEHDAIQYGIWFWSVVVRWKRFISHKSSTQDPIVNVLFFCNYRSFWVHQHLIKTMLLLRCVFSIFTWWLLWTESPTTHHLLKTRTNKNAQTYGHLSIQWKSHNRLAYQSTAMFWYSCIFYPRSSC